ncbi:MAPEG family protein [Phenylobacterium sp.]|uniref:MAPEG family protein n=1 Tax=Phenylobacterium sp. TaxID=1871053 RepID=UPI0035B4EB6F
MDTTAVELKLLGAAIVVGLVQLLWAAIASWSQRDLQWAAGSRDEPRPPLTGGPGRLERAWRNFLETFPLFAAAVVAAVLLAKTGPLTMWGSAVYVIGRALYVPLYVSGVPMVRSVVWGVSMVGLGLVVVAIFR